MEVFFQLVDSQILDMDNHHALGDYQGVKVSHRMLVSVHIFTSGV